MTEQAVAPRVAMTPAAAGDIPGIAQRVARVIRRIIGVPDYETYVAHMRVHHPGQEPMSERDFHRERLTARYSRPGSRCC